jgi:hypothetical protein
VVAVSPFRAKRVLESVLRVVAYSVLGGCYGDGVRGCCSFKL